MARIFFIAATAFFFLAAVGAHFIPNPTSWDFVALSLGFAVGGWTPWKKSA